MDVEHMKKIALDIHDVVADYMGHFIYLHGWPDRWDELLTNMYDDFPEDHFADAEFLAELPVIRNGPSGVRKLAAGGWEPFFLTATHDYGENLKATHTWLALNKLDGFPVVFPGGMQEKVDWFTPQNMMEVAWVIDDHAQILRPLLEKGYDNVIIMDAPWNREIEGGHRFRNWVDIVDFIGSY